MPRPGLVFIATRVPWPVATGHYLRTFNILRGLAELYDIHFFGFHEPSASPEAIDKAREALGQFCVTVTTKKLKSETSPLRLLGAGLWATLRFEPLVAEKYRDADFSRAIQRAASRDDVIALHGDSLPSFEYLRHVKKPQILTNHNVEWKRLQTLAAAESNPVKRMLLRWQARLMKSYEARAIRAVGHCVVVSDADRLELQAIESSARYSVVPNGTDTSQSPPGFHRLDKPTALWVGGMNDEYNRLAVRHFLHRIHPMIRERIPGFRWRVVGKAPPTDLKRAAEDPASGIELAGFVEDVRDEYEGADVVVIPLVAGGGTKLKTLEAMAMGRAVVATRIGAEGIDAVPGRDLLIADEPDAFAAAVASLLMDDRKREGLAASARKLAEDKYDWKVVHKLMALAVRDAIADPARSDGNQCAA